MVKLLGGERILSTPATGIQADVDVDVQVTEIRGIRHEIYPDGRVFAVYGNERTLLTPAHTKNNQENNNLASDDYSLTL